MKTLLRASTLFCLLATTTVALAQAPAAGRGAPGGRGGPPPAPPSLISYEQAATAMAAAEEHARANNWPMTIRIVDQNNNVVMVHRMEGANPFTANIAERKTLTVIGSKMTSAEYGAKVQAGEITAIENAVTFGGGVPIYLNGELAGAIAASGAAPDQDEAVSKAGVEAIGGSISAN
jgi:glc operon protein GlcG